MAFPYLSDVINYAFGTNLSIPIAMFGAFVAISIITATAIAKQEVLRFEKRGILPKEKSHQTLDSLVFTSVLIGFVGARAFHILEYPALFMHAPFNMIFSTSGFSIYGGLIFATLAGTVFLRSKNIPVIPMLDALAPSLALGYAIGRIGCQISGDGDWGITANMSLKPQWLPDWLWAQTYENNVVGILIQSPGVYPTPLYEVCLSLCVFIVLWSVRKTAYSTGFLFSLYLVLSGFSRLLIEKIRINSEYHLYHFAFTQAELIASICILLGLVGILKTSRSKLPFKVGLSFLILGAFTACTKL